MPSPKTGIDASATEAIDEYRSLLVRGRLASQTPIASEIGSDSSSETTARISVCSKRGMIVGLIAAPVSGDVPQSPRTKFPSHAR